MRTLLSLPSFLCLSQESSRRASARRRDLFSSRTMTWADWTPVTSTGMTEGRLDHARESGTFSTPSKDSSQIIQLLSNFPLPHPSPQLGKTAQSSRHRMGKPGSRTGRIYGLANARFPMMVAEADDEGWEILRRSPKRSGQAESLNTPYLEIPRLPHSLFKGRMDHASQPQRPVPVRPNMLARTSAA